MNTLQKCFRHLNIKDMFWRTASTCSVQATSQPSGTKSPIPDPALLDCNITFNNRRAPTPLNTSLSTAKVSYELPEAGLPDITKTIIEPVKQISIVDCPKFNSLVNHNSVIGDDMPSGVVIIDDPIARLPIVKKAKNILKIRRRKMNRHKLKKFRKRMLFLHRKLRFRKAKKKEKAIQEKLAAIRQKGTDFDALEYVKGQLELARKGGYSIEVFRNRHSTLE